MGKWSQRARHAASVMHNVTPIDPGEGESMSANVESQHSSSRDADGDRDPNRTNYQSIGEAEFDAVLNAIGRAIDVNYGDTPSVRTSNLRKHFEAGDLSKKTVGRALVALANGDRDGGDINVWWFSDPKTEGDNVFLARRKRGRERDAEPLTDP